MSERGRYKMPQYKEVIIREQPNVKTGSDWLTIIIALLGALKLVLAAPPFEIEIPDATMDAWANIISVIFMGYGIFANTYLNKKEQQQKDVLEQTGLTKDKTG